MSSFGVILLMCDVSTIDGMDQLAQLKYALTLHDTWRIYWEQTIKGMFYCKLLIFFFLIIPKFCFVIFSNLRKVLK